MQFLSARRACMQSKCNYSREERTNSSFHHRKTDDVHSEKGRRRGLSDTDTGSIKALIDPIEDKLRDKLNLCVQLDGL